MSRRDPNKNRTLCNQVWTQTKWVKLHKPPKWPRIPLSWVTATSLTKYSSNLYLVFPFQREHWDIQSENSPLPITIHPEHSQLAEPTPKSPNTSPHSSSPFKSLFNLIDFWLHRVLLCTGLFQLRGCGAWAPPCGDFAHCRAQAPGVRASVVAVPRL